MCYKDNIFWTNIENLIVSWMYFKHFICVCVCVCNQMLRCNMQWFWQLLSSTLLCFFHNLSEGQSMIMLSETVLLCCSPSRPGQGKVGPQPYLLQWGGDLVVPASRCPAGIHRLLHLPGHVVGTPNLWPHGPPILSSLKPDLYRALRHYQLHFCCCAHLYLHMGVSLTEEEQFAVPAAGDMDKEM